MNIPHDLESEQYVIGSMLYEPDCIHEVADLLQSKHFYKAEHKRIFEVVMDIWDRDPQLVDIVNVVDRIKDKHELTSYTLELAQSIPSAKQIRFHAEKIKDLAVARFAVKVGQQLSALGEIRDVDEIKKQILQAEKNLVKAIDITAKTESMKDMRSLAFKFAEEFDQAYNRKEGMTGVPSGLIDLDARTSGFQKSDLIVLAGRPSVGKTAFALHLAKHMSFDEKLPCLFFSLEMGDTQLFRRMAAMTGNINAQKLMNGMLTQEEYQKLTKTIGILSNANLVVDDDPSANIQQMRAKARKMKREKGLACVFIDYLGQIPGEKGQNTYERVSENTRELKRLARELECPVVVLCQLSRNVEHRQDKRPMLSDLRESGEIEQAADIVFMLYRDDYYDRESENKNIIELIIAKHRNGPVGTVQLGFLKEYNKFLPLSSH